MVALRHKLCKCSFNIGIDIKREINPVRAWIVYVNGMNCGRSVCDLTHCSVARLGSRWALTLAPHCVQLIWTRTACRTCWWGHPCTASSGMRARCLCTSARAMWVGSVGQWEHDTTTFRLILPQYVQFLPLNHTDVHLYTVIIVCSVDFQLSSSLISFWLCLLSWYWNKTVEHCVIRLWDYLTDQD